MVMAKAGSGFALVKREERPVKSRPARPSVVVSVQEMSPSWRRLKRSTGRGKPTERELAMRASRTRLRIQKRLGIKRRIRYNPAQLALRAQRKTSRKRS